VRRDPVERATENLHGFLRREHRKRVAEARALAKARAADARTRGAPATARAVEDACRDVIEILRRV
jgi:hypothetical protein